MKRSWQQCYFCKRFVGLDRFMCDECAEKSIAEEFARLEQSWI